VSPKDKKFVNPLLRPTELSTEAGTETPTQESTETMAQAPTQMPTESPTSTSTSATTYTSLEDILDEPVERRKRGKQAFDKIHMRWTLWINKKLKKQIDKLAKDEEVSLVALAEEAFTDLLRKHGRIQ
jgi:predicted HicB family RNase H-like nuclease